MQKLSVVILTKNEERNIRECIENAKQISNDIIVVDSGSTDNTIKIAKTVGAKVVFHPWKVYADSANWGITQTCYDWVLLLDADERLSQGLIDSINKVKLKPDCIYGFYRRSFIGQKYIRFGEWSGNRVFRLYHRNKTSWDDTPIHSKLYTDNIKRVMLYGYALHFTMKDIDDLKNKYKGYIQEIRKTADKRKFGIIKKYTSPVFRFTKGYIFKLGFLDGKEGFKIACLSARYVYAKYAK